MNGGGEAGGRGTSISVVIPTWRRVATLRRTLDALAAELARFAQAETENTAQPKRRAEVIVVCDGEDAATRALAESYAAMPVEWIFLQQNAGLAAARNAGAARAGGELLLFLDDDMEAMPGLLRMHSEAHARAEAGEPDFAFAVCGRIVEAGCQPQKTRTGEMLERSWMRTLAVVEAAREPREADRIPADAVEMSCFGANCSIRREVFAEAGGFQPALRWMEEEMELGCRLDRCGVLFVGEARAGVRHRNDKEMEAYFRRCWRLGGGCDALRALELGERNGQTRRLLRMDAGPALSRIAHRAFWYGHRGAHRIAALLRAGTEATGSWLSFRLWHDVERTARYWEGVRETGCGREQLRAMAQPRRVLMLHSIAEPRDAAEASYYLSPQRWEWLLETMRVQGYSCADPNKLLDEQARWGERELVVTFDDGYDDFYTEVFPRMERYGLRPLLFLPVDWIGRENGWDQARGLRPRRLLELDQIRELQRCGVRFGSHTRTHPSLPRLKAEELRRELADSKRRLEDVLGEEVRFFAYPFGDCDARVRAAVIEAGYRMAFTTVKGLNLWQDPFAMLRMEWNQRLPLWAYGWKLHSGLHPRQSVKYELGPLWRMLPRELRHPAAEAWRRWRSRGQPA